jgi:hypothetical protein
MTKRLAFRWQPGKICAAKACAKAQHMTLGGEYAMIEMSRRHLAQTTRHKFYDMAAAEKAMVVGFHFTFPSIGHVEKNGSKYRLVAIAWNAVI